MLLAIDIGNTLTKFGVFEGESLHSRTAIPTVRHCAAEEIRNQTNFENIRAVIISSVVPETENAYRKFSKKHLSLKPVFVDYTFDFNLKINYHPPESLGIDRLVNAFSAVEKYGAPCIVCSLGTATTIDAVSGNREFLGGAIAPGMFLMSEMLAQKTSRLSGVTFGTIKGVFGNSTEQSIQAGIHYGSGGLIDRIIEEMIDELGVQPKIISTGGAARRAAAFSKKIKLIDENLLLEGLRIIYENLR
ncbi:MAG: type III pantothenate kinase [Pyrinomonadaceae bacterium]